MPFRGAGLWWIRREYAYSPFGRSPVKTAWPASSPKSRDWLMAAVFGIAPTSMSPIARSKRRLLAGKWIAIGIASF